MRIATKDDFVKLLGAKSRYRSINSRFKQKVLVV